MVNARWRDMPKKQPPHKRGGFLPILVMLGLVLVGCAKPRTSMPPGDSVTLPNAKSRLGLAVSTLPGEATAVRYTSRDGRYIEETAAWGGTGYRNAFAGLSLSQASPAPPLTNPSDPEAVAKLWPTLREKQPAIGKLVQSRNSLGPVIWRRASIGTSACVLFVQRWAESDPAAPNAKASNLSGFYCNAPGIPLAPGAAETVVRSISLRQMPQGQ